GALGAVRGARRRGRVPARVPPGAPRGVKKERGGDRRAGGGPRREVAQAPPLDAAPDAALGVLPPHESLSTARRRALRARGFPRTSSSLAPTGFFVRTFHCAVRPQAHTGSWGGQMHPVARRARTRFTNQCSRGRAERA